MNTQPAAEMLEARALLSAGSLDVSFDNDGIVTTNFIPVTNTSGWSDSASSIALQGDGKMVVAGTIQPNGGPMGAISRYNPDGSLDTTFATGGKISDARFNTLQDVAVQSDGKIVVVGRAYPMNGAAGNFAIGRFNADGSPDATFGTNGIVVTNPGVYDTAYAVSLLDDGKILVTGQSGQPGPEQPYGFTVQKFNSDGTIDTSFGIAGKVRTFYSTAEIGNGYARTGNVGGRDLVVQPDGKIIVAGHSLNGDSLNGYQNGFAAVRYNVDGSLDTSFDTDGRVYTNLGSGQHWGTSVALQADGKVIVGGYLIKLSPVVDADFALVRYNADGSLDTTFDGDGKLVVERSATQDYINDVKIQPDGAIVVTGSVGNLLAVSRFNPDGSSDAAFGNNGLVTTAVQASASGSKLIVQPDGAIVVAGTVNNGNGNQFLNRDFVVARYNGLSPVAVSIAAANDASETGSVAGKFTVTLNAATTVDTVVSYSVLASSTTTVGADYATLSGTVTIPAGSTSADIIVSGIANDLIVESNETISIQLTGSTAGTSVINKGSDTATISVLDNDSATVSIGNASVTEGNSGTTVLSFPVTLSNSVDVAVSVDYTTQDGTAIAGSDYVAQSGTLTIPAGSTTGTIDITVNGDTTVELDETLNVVLSNLQAGGRNVELIGPSSVIYSNDFDGGVTDWTYNTTSRELTSVYTEFLGRFGGGAVNSTTINVGAAATVLVSFDMFEFNSWDGELFKVFADGVLVVNDSFAQEDNYGDYDGTSKPHAISIDNRAPQIPNTFGHLTEIWHYEFTVNTTGPTLELSFGSTLNQSVYDESWGIDNLTLAASFGVTSTTAAGTIINDDFNTPPTANADSVTTDEDSAVTFNVLANDTDSENNIVASLTTATSSPAGGVLTDNGNGSFTFNPNGAFESLAAGESAQVSFDYQIEDAYGETSTATVTIAIDGVNDVATISGDNVGDMTEDANGDSGVLTVTDLDDAENVFQPLTNVAGTYGTFSIDATGNWNYTRTANLESLAVSESVVDSFTVVSLDGTASEVVTITITGENDAPVISGVVSSNATLSNASENGVVTISGSFSDIDTSDTHSATINWGDGTVATVSVDQLADTLAGSHTYQQGGIFTFTVTVDDGHGGTASSTATAVVEGAGVVNGTLYIIGTDGHDHVDLKFNEKKDQLKVDVKLNQGGGSDGSSDGGSDCGSDGGSDGGGDRIRQTLNISSIDRIVTYLRAGDDQYNGGSDGGSDGGRDGGSGQAAISQFVFGGAGNDNIKGGRGNDVLSGGSGRDDIKGGSGADIIIGGTGKDNLQGGRGNDLIIGGSTANEDDLFALDQALAAWSSDDLTAALSFIGTVTDDNEKDDLFGEDGNDYLHFGNGDKRKN